MEGSESKKADVGSFGTRSRQTDPMVDVDAASNSQSHKSGPWKDSPSDDYDSDSGSDCTTYYLCPDLNCDMEMDSLKDLELHAKRCHPNLGDIDTSENTGENWLSGVTFSNYKRGRSEEDEATLPNIDTCQSLQKGMKLDPFLYHYSHPEGQELVRCCCCDIPFSRWKHHRDHMVDKHWKNKPADFNPDSLLRRTPKADEEEEEDEEDSISAAANVSSLSIQDSKQRKPEPKNWFRQVYRRNMDRMKAAGYDFDSYSYNSDPEKDSYWDRALPLEFTYLHLDHCKYSEKNVTPYIREDPEAKRARIQEHNERVRKKYNLDVSDMDNIPLGKLIEDDDLLDDKERSQSQEEEEEEE